MKIQYDGIEWGGPDSNFYYFYWWNPLPKGDRYWGRLDFWYDCPHATYGLWFTSLSWSTRWTVCKE